MRHLPRPLWTLILGAAALSAATSPGAATAGRAPARADQGTETATAEASPMDTATAEPNPTATATPAALPTDTAPPPTPTAAPRPIYLPWVDRRGEAVKSAAR